MTPEPDSQQPLIELSDIRFRYPGGEFELGLPRMSIQASETVALTGPSGCGKTTLVNLISGILTPQSGGVRVDGIPVSSLGDVARRAFRISTIGFLFQDTGLLDYLNAEENILLPFLINRSLKNTDTDIRARARQFAESLGVGHRLKRKPAELSGGECQRVAIARALVTHPNLIIADEPTASLDPDNAARTMDLILETSRSQNATLLTITHDPAMARRHDRTINLPSVLTAP